jgi:hypothetical protein
MKHTHRKLSLHAQTLRNLSAGQLGQVVGAYSSAKATMCSTVEDTNCIETGTCASINGSCVTGCCDPHTAGNCSNAC